VILELLHWLKVVPLLLALAVLLEFLKSVPLGLKPCCTKPTVRVEVVSVSDVLELTETEANT
jgi:hypothetical protein